MVSRTSFLLVNGINVEVIAINSFIVLAICSFERALVGTALSGMLAVYERMILLSVLVGMGECYLDIFDSFAKV